MPTNDLSRPVIPAALPRSDAKNDAVPIAVNQGWLRDTPRPICAIHQPNFLPRLSTLAKIYAADYWIVLNDVQFVRHDYQHRARVASLSNVDQEFWLTLPVHLPNGRNTSICDVLIVEPADTRRKVELALQHAYGGSPHWPTLHKSLEPALELITDSGRVQDVAEASTRGLLSLLDWPGKIVRSSMYDVREERSARLAYLTRATGCYTYLCGTGGSRYLEDGYFTSAGLLVRHYPPSADSHPTWSGAPRYAALQALAKYGPDEVRLKLATLATETVGTRH